MPSVGFIDVYGRIWPDATQACIVCGQPDNCGDCNHERLADDEVIELGGKLQQGDEG